MRTTLVLDDELVVSAKKRAAEQHTTFSEVVNHALRESFDPSPSIARQSFVMPTYGDEGPVFSMSAEQIAALRDADA